MGTEHYGNQLTGHLGTIHAIRSAAASVASRLHFHPQLWTRIRT